MTVQGESVCPRPDEVARALDPLLVPGDRGAIHGRAELVPDGPSLRLRLLRPDGTLLSEKRLSAEPSCAAMAETVAVVLAAWVAQLQADMPYAFEMPPRVDRQVDAEQPVMAAALPPAPAARRWNGTVGCGGKTALGAHARDAQVDLQTGVSRGDGFPGTGGGVTGGNGGALAGGYSGEMFGGGGAAGNAGGGVAGGITAGGSAGTAATGGVAGAGAGGAGGGGGSLATGGSTGISLGGSAGRVAGGSSGSTATGGVADAGAGGAGGKTTGPGVDGAAADGPPHWRESSDTLCTGFQNLRPLRRACGATIAVSLPLYRTATIRFRFRPTAERGGAPTSAGPRARNTSLGGFVESWTVLWSLSAISHAPSSWSTMAARTVAVPLPLSPICSS